MNITRTTTPESVCVLTFDRPNSSANIFDRATLDELNAHLGAIETDSTLRGVILATAKPKIFIAGADLNSLGRAGAVDEASSLVRPNTRQDASSTLADMVETGQRTFHRLSLLPIPSVAAIHGTCLGGGLEIALACDWRVASTDKATKLGLPETQLGILPAWGGSTRLPKLIGLPNALPLILSGKQLVAAQAQKNGMVDEVAHPEYLLDAAKKFIARGKRPEKSTPWMNRSPLARLVAAKARKEVLAKTRGHYPAPLKAIDVCVRAAHASIEEGFAAEKAAFLELVRGPECRALMSVFFLQERAKKLQVAQASSPAFDKGAGGTPALPVRRVAVIGAGTMGAGIAQWTSARGFPVRLKDINPEALARGMHAIEKVYAEAVKRRAFTLPEATAGLDRITPIHTDVPLTDIDLVIEAAIEKLDLKQKVFRDLEVRVGPHTVLATNTSALSIDQIAAGLARPERVVGLHFFNPVHRMQLVEIVRGPRTSPPALETALQFVKSIGKLPVIAKDSPGFLVNRILLPYMVEAVWLFSEGVPVEEIDRVMLDFGMPMGPMRLCDEVGLDVAQHVAKDLERRLPSAVPINDTLEKMVAKGWLGKKSGKGFYLHDKKAKGERSQPNPEARALQPATPRASDTATHRDRMVLVMVNEAARVLAEGVVESPEDVDFGMIMGTGWAPFRGGPCRYADGVGADAIVKRLEQLTHEIAPHFEPAPRLRELAAKGRGFYSYVAVKPAAEAKVGPALRAGLSSSIETAAVAANPGPLGERTPPTETAHETAAAK